MDEDIKIADIKIAAYNLQVTPVDPKMVDMLNTHTRARKKKDGVVGGEEDPKNSQALEQEKNLLIMKFSLGHTDNISYIQSEFLVKETAQIAYSFGLISPLFGKM